MKPSPADKFADVMFPLQGISLSDSYANQQPGTTPVGVNVRTYEAITQRARGGARAGLSRYLAAQLPNGAHLIQHLGVIVDPQGGALLDIDDGAFPDPSSAGQPSSWGIFGTRNPGRLVRVGGSGRMQFKNKKPKGFKYVQGATNYTATGPFAPFLPAVAFPANVNAGDLLIVGSSLTNAASLATVNDSMGSSYFPIASIADVNGFSTFAGLWYAIAPANGANTVTVTDNGLRAPGFVIAEYSGNASLPLNGESTHEDTILVYTFVPNPIPFNTGLVPVSASGELVVGFTVGARTAASGSSIAGDPAFTVRLNTSGSGFATGYPLIVLQDQTSVGASVQVNGTNTMDAGAGGSGPIILSIGASFFKA